MNDWKIWHVKYAWKILMTMTTSWSYATNVTEDFIFIVWARHLKRYLRSHFFVRIVLLKRRNRKKSCKRNKFRDSETLKCWFWRTRQEEDKRNHLMSQYHLWMKTITEYSVFWKSRRKRLRDNYWAKRLMKNKWRLNNRTSRLLVKRR